jgi:hypothetical protein
MFLGVSSLGLFFLFNLLYVGSSLLELVFCIEMISPMYPVLSCNSFVDAAYGEKTELAWILVFLNHFYINLLLLQKIKI